MAIKAKIEIDNSELKKGLKDAEGQASKSMKNIKSVTNGSTTALSKFAKAAQTASTTIKSGFSGVTSLLSKIGPIGWAAAAGITVIGGAVAGVFKGVGKLTSKLDGISKSAKSVNMTANQYLALQYASSKAGVSMENILNLIGKIDYALIQAADGEKKYVDAFHKIGLSWQELTKMSPDKYFIEVADAMKAYKDASGSLPREAFDIFGRKDMATINKIMNEDKFSKYVAEAGALGFEIKPGMITAAEAYRDVVGETQQELLAMVSNLETVEKITNALTRFWDTIGSKIADANGKVRKDYKDNWEGIGDIAERMLINSKERKSIPDYMKREIYAQAMAEENRRQYTKGETSVMIDYKAYFKKASQMTSEELDKAFTSAVTTIDTDNLSSAIKKLLFKAVEGVDSRYNANDKTTWVQRKRLSLDEINARDQTNRESLASDDAQLLVKNLEKVKDHYDKASQSANKLVNAQKAIYEIQKKYNAELSETDKHDILLKASATNSTIIDAEIKSFREMRNKSFDDFYANMITNMGANGDVVKQLFSSFKNIGSRNQENNLFGSLKYQYFKEKMPKAPFESDNQYIERINSQEFYKTPQEFLQKDPFGFTRAIQGIAKSFNENDILAPISTLQNEMIVTTAKRYDEFAKKNKLQQFPFPKDLLNADPLEQAGAFEVLSEMIQNIANYKDQQIKELTKLQREYEIVNNEGDKYILKEKMERIKKSINGDEFKILEQFLARIHPEVLARGRIGFEAMASNNLANFQKHAQTTQSFYNDAKGINTEIRTLKDEALLDQKAIDLNKRKALLKSKGLEASEENLKLYQKELDYIMKANKELGFTKVRADLLSGSKDTKLNFMSRMGYSEEASIARALDKAYETKGSALTNEQADLVKAFAKNEWKMENIKMPELRNDVIHTNELAAKGGFSSSVAVERRDSTTAIENFQKEVYKLWQQQITLDTQIRNSLKN